MTDMITIRQANSADSDLLSKIIHKSYQTVAERFGLTPENCPKHPSNCSREWIQNDIERGVEYFMLACNDTIVGCVAFEHVDAERCYLERLSVLPEYRCKGLGRALVEQVFIKAKSIHLKTVCIGIIAKQTELKAWYQKIGFVEGESKAFPHLPFRVTFLMYELSLG